jgi:hypothetical protein
MFSAPKTSLAYHLKAHGLAQRIDASQVTLSQLVQPMKKFKTQEPLVYPDHEVVEYYFGNHVIAELRSRQGLFAPLAGKNLEFVSNHYAAMNKSLQRLFYYAFLICAREARHLKNKSFFIKKIPAPYYHFISAIPDSPNDAIHYLTTYKDPTLELGMLVRCLEFVFYYGSWETGYGGSAWGLVASTLRRYIYGEYSGEMFMDTAYTLCHNNGPIFNKDMLYYKYTSIFRAALNAQREGLIPYFLEYHKSFGDQRIKAMKDLAIGMFGENWYPKGTVYQVTNYSDVADAGMKGLAESYAQELSAYFNTQGLVYENCNEDYEDTDDDDNVIDNESFFAYDPTNKDKVVVVPNVLSYTKVER